MTSTDEFMTLTEAAKYIGGTVERAEQLILQGVIDAEMPGRGVSRQSCDYWLANQKAKHNGTMQTKIARPATVTQTGDTSRRFTTWTRKEIATLKKYWGTEDPEITAARVGRTVPGCNTKWGSLRRKGKIRATEKEPGSRRRSPGVIIAPGTYSTAEFAEAIGKDERFVRYLCADKTIRAEKKPLSTKMGKRAATWVIYTHPSEYIANPIKSNAHHKKKGEAASEGHSNPVAETPARPLGGLLARVASACAIFKRGRA